MLRTWNTAGGGRAKNTRQSPIKHRVTGPRHFGIGDSSAALARKSAKGLSYHNMQYEDDVDNPSKGLSVVTRGRQDKTEDMIKTPLTSESFPYRP